MCKPSRLRLPDVARLSIPLRLAAGACLAAGDRLAIVFVTAKFLVFQHDMDDTRKRMIRPILVRHRAGSSGGGRGQPLLLVTVLRETKQIMSPWKHVPIITYGRMKYADAADVDSDSWEETNELSGS